MQNLLVTGGCGFIGSNFIRYLLEESGFTGRIINVDSLTYAGNPLSLKDIEKKFPQRYVFIHADICDQTKMQETFSRYNIDTVCHFAAESHVDRSISSPDEFIRTNIMGTFTLLEIARKNAKQLQRFHHISTDEVFGSLGPEGYFLEDTPYHPNNPYSASKAGSDHLVRAYGNTYQLPITISNCSNNYGPFQFPEKLIPLTIMNLCCGKSIPVYGDGQNMRDWLFVRDHCVAIWQILQNGKLGETYNIGGDNDLSNLTLVEALCDIVESIHRDEGRDIDRPYRELINFVKDRPGHDWRYAIDAGKMKRELNWQPEESWETGLRKTVEWYLKNSEWVESVQSGAYREWVDIHYNGKQPVSLPTPPAIKKRKPTGFRFC